MQPVVLRESNPRVYLFNKHAPIDISRAEALRRLLKKHDARVAEANAIRATLPGSPQSSLASWLRGIWER